MAANITSSSASTIVSSPASTASSTASSMSSSPPALAASSSSTAAKTSSYFYDQSQLISIFKLEIHVSLKYRFAALEIKGPAELPQEILKTVAETALLQAQLDYRPVMDRELEMRLGRAVVWNSSQIANRAHDDERLAKAQADLKLRGISYEIKAAS